MKPGIHKHILTLLYIGLLLMPFSTGMDSAAVLAYGLPFVILAAFLALLLLPRAAFQRSLLFDIVIACLFIACVLYFTLLSPDLQRSLPRAGVNLLGFLIFLHIASYSTMAGEKLFTVFERLNLWLMISGTVMALYYLLHLAWVLSTNDPASAFLDRATGGLMALPWGASNVIAAPLTIPMISALYFIVASPHRAIGRWAYLVLGLIVLAVLLTFSRGALMILTLTATLLSLQTRKIAPLLVFALLFILLYLGLSHFMPEAWNELITARTEDVAGGNGRLAIWQEALHFFSQNPVSASGYYASFNVLGVTAHNLFINTLVEQGVTGLLVIFLLVLGVIIRAGYGMFSADRARRLVSSVFAIGAIAIFANLQVEDAYFTYQYMVYFWVFLGLVSLSQFIVIPDAQASRPIEPRYGFQP